MASAARARVRKSDPDYIPKTPRKRLAAVPSPNEQVVEQGLTQEEQLKLISEFAEGLPTKFLQCRELNHNWKPYHVGRLPGGAFERTLRCTRCWTRKVQALTTRGAIVRTHYEYAEGYERKGLGRITGEGRDTLRLASILRLDIKDLSKDY